MSSSPNLTDPNHKLDPIKNYKRVVFQQGKPLLDVDLNDISQALEAQHLNGVIQKMGYGPSQTDYREWAIVPNNPVPHSSANEDSFSITAGRLDTRKGVILADNDTANNLFGSELVQFPFGSRVPSSGNETPTNYILIGYVSSIEGFDTITDTSKNFVGDLQGHRLLDYDYTEDLTCDFTEIHLTVKNDQVKSKGTFRARLTESKCQVYFEGYGGLFDIESANGTSLTVSALPNNLAVGTKYVIVPPNTLAEYRAMYDAAQTQEASKHEGLNGLPQLVTYVQVFEEDISAQEDSSIQSSTLGFETTHRTQLRWCVRVAMLRMSKDGDSVDGDPRVSLGLEHIQQFFTDHDMFEFSPLLDGASKTDQESSAYGGFFGRANQSVVYWQQRELDGTSVTPLSNTLGNQDSSFTDSFGLSPAHFYNKAELTLDNLFWGFIKGLFLKSQWNSDLVGFDGFNDFVILNMFHSESKTNAANVANETLSPYFYPALTTDHTTDPVEHAWLSTGSSFQAADGDTGATPAFFKSPPRVFHTHAELSTDNMQSRSLYGLRGGLIYGENAPLVFESVAKHLSFIDQALLGLSGLGSAQGATREGHRIPAAVNFTLEDTTTGIAQAGYGVGAIKPLNPLATDSEFTGFLGGNSSYLLREKGTRDSHTVNYDDADLGWSFYASQGTDLVDGGESDFSVRSWEQGPAQASAFLKGLNFRKLAIKTVAHREMDLFTISEAPAKTNADLGDVFTRYASATAFQIPFLQSQPLNGNLFLDSYSAASTDYLIGDPYTQDANVSDYSTQSARFEASVAPLLRSYLHSGGIKDFGSSPRYETISPLVAHRDHETSFGPWNRFDRTDALDSAVYSDDNERAIFTSDLMENRCTAMRLRYHVGDFYPSADEDAQGFRRNLLVDSLNLFVKVEPLSLTHWMTMPKHQHTILENSISFAEGIEALLKVAHGLGDTQKLLNGSGDPLVQSDSPVLSDTSLTELGVEVGDIDPLNLPFGHEKHPFVHWYHPAMHKIKAPLPNDTTDQFNAGGDGSVDYQLTAYPKWGRRSLIVPALVPSTFGVATMTEGDTDYKVPFTESRTPSGAGAYTDAVTLDNSSLDMDVEDRTTALFTDAFPYPYHGSQPNDNGTTNYTTDNGDVISLRNNQITFPAIGTADNGVVAGPVFLPASRAYAKQTGDSANHAQVGFHTFIENFSTLYWNDVSNVEATFPYDERSLHYTQESGGFNELFSEYQYDFQSWSVPVMRAAISTRTVAGVVDLVRTSFETGMNDLTLNNDYDFSMPIHAVTNFGEYTLQPNLSTASYLHEEIPTVGPNSPVDTLFVGDLGTALGGFRDRAGFLSPLVLGVPMRQRTGVMANSNANIDQDVRDSFELAKLTMDQASPLLASFNAINDMGLQQKLMWNCSFRVLHSRPSGMGNGKSTPPKSLTEAFLVRDRVNDMPKPLTFGPERADRKPFIHLLSTHPATPSDFPNKANLEHLYPMVSDSTGGSHATGTEDPTTGKTLYDYTEALVKTSSMGDTYAADPFDYQINQAYLGEGNNPVREHDLLETNSGMEIDLIAELDAIHSQPDYYGLDTPATVNGTDLKFIDMMPTANELTQAGDHELIFVLYTSHYGAKMFDNLDEVEASHLPPVAGCHLTATVEINRPSDRVRSTNDDEHHYGLTVNGEPINTYSIPSTK